MKMQHEKGSRTIKVTGIPMEIAGCHPEMPELDITVMYVGNSSATRGVVLDNAIIPAIVAAVNDQHQHTGFAKVVWTREDISQMRPEWSPERCEEELAAIEGNLQDRMIEMGWNVIETLLPNK